MTLYINDAYVKSTTSIQKNVRDLSSFIQLAQSLYILPAFGSNITTAITYAIDNSTLVVGSDLDILLTNFIKPALAYRTAYLALNAIHYQITETGVITKSGGDNLAVDKKTISELQNDYGNLAQEFIKAGLDYVEKNINSFQGYVLEFKTKDTDHRKPKQLGNILFKWRGGSCGQGSIHY